MQTKVHKHIFPGARMKSLIQKLVETQGPSGYEGQIRSVVREEIEPLSDSIQVDALGNLVARKGKGSAQGLKIMLAAHIDEIGVMVTQVDENGFIRFTTLGGVRPYTCVGGRVCFLNGVQGVISMEPPDDPNKLPTFEQLYIDAGLSSKHDAPVRTGDVATFERPFLDLGNRLVSKAMDDRIGTAVLIEAMRQVKETPHQLFFVFSTQEEVGLRGATTAAYAIDPDIGLSVDVTGTGDTPRRSKVRMEVSLGKGPAIKIRDGGMLADRRVVDWMVAGSEKRGLPYQLEILEGGTTDARAMQITRAGVPAGCLSIPCRYIHSPSEMVDFMDVQNAVQLLVELVSNLVQI
jgi:putative aminopeptidase FrvX